jgi:amino acid adenylation domain-containing protein
MHSRRHAYPDPHRDTSQTPSTLVDLLRTRAIYQPDFLGYTFLADGESKEVNLTYGDLHRQACAIAAALQEAGMAGERALMLFPPGLEFLTAFFGCLYSQVVAVPAYPPDRTRLNRTLPRLRAIIADAQAKVVLTTTPILALAEPFFAQAPDLASLKWLATDSVAMTAGEDVEPTGIDPDTLAFLQYTSGSTGAPKGVMLSHANLLHNASVLHYAFSHTTEDRYASWLPTFHDMGFMVGILQPLFAGIPAVLMSPVAFLQSPIRWLRAISRYKATTSGGPNFAYDLCARKITPEERATLDLSSWSIAFNGSEPIRAETLKRFAATFESCGFRREAFYPCYGLAEATLIVSGGHKPELPVVKTFSARAIEANLVIAPDENDRDAIEMVSSGQSLPEGKIRIVDPESLIECLEGEIGEVWVSSPSVAQGYWHRSQESEQTFAAHIRDTEEGPFLRTGDLGFLQDGELFVAGRRKDLIIIRGHNHYPQDIEQTVERCHAALKPGCGAAFSVDAEGEERLVVVQELDDKEQPPVDSIIESIRRAIADEHAIQAYGVVLVKSKTIHKTSSGKIQRHACRNGFVSGNLDVVGEWRATLSAVDEQSTFDPEVALQSVAAIESSLVSQLASKLRVQPSEINIDLPLSRYALDSLAAIELTHYIEKELGVVLPMVSLLEELSIAQLAAQAFTQLIEPAATPATSVDLFDEAVGGYPLSYGQRALWFLYQLAPDTSAYNIANAVRIHADLNTVALRNAFQALVNRHPSLRTTFSAPDGEPFQHVNEFMEVSFRTEDATAWDQATLDERMVAESHLSFDLERGPLLRITLFKQSALDHIMLLVVHHIAVDFWSLGVLLHELGALYEAEQNGASATLAPLTLRYIDYIRWQADRLAGSEGERMWAYWQEQLAGDLPTLNLPADRPRPAVQTYCGASQTFKLNAEMTDGLTALARAHGATLYTALLAAFQVLLYRYSGEEDILVGSPTAGRAQAEFSNVVGYFVNPVILRADFSDDPTFDKFLDDARQTVLSALAYQDYPFNLLVERLQPDRDPARPPLFQVMFVLQKVPLLNEQGLASFALGEGGEKIQLGCLPLESMPLQQRVAQFDLTLAMAETDGGLAGSLQYNTDLFEPATISRIIENFKCLLVSILTDPARQVSQLPLITESERRLLTGWNQARADYPDDQCIHQVFEAQAERTSEADAVIFEDKRISYGELNRRANQLAHRLLALGVMPESSVGVCMQPSIEMVIALLGTLKSGGVYVPLDPQHPSERLAFMMEDSNVRVLLTERQFAARLPAAALPHEVIRLDSDSDEIARSSGLNPHNLVEPDNLAYVIYTSGSTGTPKGACISHRTAVNHFFVAGKQFGLSSSDVVLQFASFSFDVSLEQILPALFIGASVALRGAEAWSATDFIRKISELKLTVINPATAYWHQLVKDCAANEEKILGNQLRLVIAGGDAMLPEPVRLWQKSQPDSIRLLNAYGPTEATITSAVFEVPPAFCEASPLRRIPIGRPLENRTMYILDKRGNLAPSGVVGELHIGGNLLARGYLNRPDLTAERFIPDCFSNQPGARLYKTGDLTRYLSDGNIEFLGRMDYQVKVRGFRIELGELEAALDQHRAVRECVVKAREDEPGDKRLVAYVVASEGETITTNELREFMKERLPHYMVPAAFVLLEALPLTPNGKIDHRRLPPPDWSGSELAESFTAPRTHVEEMLGGIWSKVLGVERLSVHDNFFDLGGHSLLATQVVSRVRKVLQIELPLRSLFEHTTIAALAENIEAIQKTQQKPSPLEILHVSRQADLPLSFAQQRLWFLEQFEPDSYAYNMPGAIRLTGSLDIAALERSLNEVVRRHEALRTTFKLKDGEPVQVISPALTLPLPVEDLSLKAESERESIAFEWANEEAARPFDLERGPLIRANLLRLDEEDHRMLVTLHHIICDGWSLGVFLRELTELYGAYSQSKPSPLSELEVQYADFAHWQRQWLRDDVLSEQLSSWEKQLGGELPTLHLRADHPRPAVQTYRGATHPLEISKNLTESLKAVSRRHEATLFMTLLAAFKTLLYRFTGQEDVLVGSTIANRNRAEIEGLIGFFVNTLVLRTDLSGDPTFYELLKRVREVTLGAYAHQDLPFEKLVERLQPERSLSHSPLFQVMLILQNDAMPTLHSSGLTFKPAQVDNGTSIFDMTLELVEMEGGMTGALNYSTDLFEPATIKRMLGYFQTLLESIAASPALKISELPLLTEQQRRQLLVEWNRTEFALPEDKTINDLIEAQVASAPGRTAVIFEGQRLSYSELNARANQLANYLRSMGAGHETLVGIYLARSFEMIVSVLGVLKSGAAYVPLDTEYPRERLAYIIDDAELSVILTASHLVETLPENKARVVCLDKDWPEVAQESEANPHSHVSPDNLAYLIYTSGSTGKPKGVMITHRSVCNRMLWGQTLHPYTETDRILQITSICFDVSVFEFFGTLINGAQLVMPAADDHKDSTRLVKLIAEQNVTVLSPVPSMMQALIAEPGIEKCNSLRYVLIGAETLPVDLKERILACLSADLYNVYGPTETTIDAAMYRCERDSNQSSVPIGRPVGNAQIHLLDDHLQPVPVGVPGMLYIGGEGVARGYLRKPDLTADKFIPNPFSDKPGQRLYKSGDLACYLPDGNIDFIGRIDDQIKIRGFRIELGEIQSALSSHTAVKEAVVLATDSSAPLAQVSPAQVSPAEVSLATDPLATNLLARVQQNGSSARDDKRLVAFVALEDDRSADSSELKDYLAANLPDYMVPSSILIIDALPLLPNGKIDRRALISLLVANRLEPGEAVVLPRTPVEETLAGIWAVVLGVEQVGIHSNFFELGGHSLLATQVISRIRDAFQVEVPVRSLFKSPDIASLAAIIEQKQLDETDSDKLVEMLADLDQLSDEEVEALLASEEGIDDEGI